MGYQYSHFNFQFITSLQEITSAGEKKNILDVIVDGVRGWTRQLHFVRGSSLSVIAKINEQRNKNTSNCRSTNRHSRYHTRPLCVRGLI